MTPEEVEETRSRLLELQKSLRDGDETAQEAAATVELDQARLGRLARMDAMQQQAMAVELNRRRELQLKRIEGALLRLDKGTYGNCVTCSTPIEQKRLDFDPTVFFCHPCAERAEKRR